MTPKGVRFSHQTVLTHSGRDPASQAGFVNTPVVRGSTVLFDNLAQLKSGDRPYKYGRHGTPTSRGAEEIVNTLEGGAVTRCTPSGMSAISLALSICVGAGDEILISDSAYEPTRNFAEKHLNRFGITARFFNPLASFELSELITAKTKAIFVESPGSLTFEIQDIPAIRAAVGPDVAIIADNTWATPLFYRPLELGADIVVHSGSKMFGGHSDVLFGTITTNERWANPMLEDYRSLGLSVSPDDAALVSRGLRTLAVRMAAHQERALEMARWLGEQPGVKRVLHPALPECPGHSIFKRDFEGSGSLFSIILEERSPDALAAMIDGLELFGLGYSWGGFESLVLPFDPRPTRTAVPWTENGPCVRIHIGFEDPEDLKSDLKGALERYLSA
ncbi:cystathionine beta-lyase [Cucumibacter marinus]|uniref:cystathionine beta-lyase n=1 Tax=Cucumibacter marinus TaxID=1121252 RepID=UPI000420E9D7|nr:cystathionine beta-lyase [Cucumibacter marinus]